MMAQACHLLVDSLDNNLKRFNTYVLNLFFMPLTLRYLFIVLLLIIMCFFIFHNIPNSRICLYHI